MSKIKRLLQNNPYLLKIINSIPLGIYICDKDETILFVNKTIERVDGIKAKEVVGKKINEVYDEHHEFVLQRVLKTNQDVSDYFYSQYSMKGKQINQICNGFRIIIDGVLEGACSVAYNTDFLGETIKDQRALQQRFIHSNTGPNHVFNQIIGESPNFLNCLSIASFAAQSDSPVFLTGSTGSGKEVFAKAVHTASSRKSKPFIAINCGAIPETLIESILFGSTKGIYTGAIDRPGIFEQAQGGTLFLDELTSMPMASQAKLLRVLEEKCVSRLGSTDVIKFDIRVISSSNIIPQKAIAEKIIREDLYYRLAVINILIPPLTERKSDILPLCHHFIGKYNETFNKGILSINENVKNFLVSYEWPGNVRELKHCIESAMNFVQDEDTEINEKHMAQFYSKVEAVDNVSHIAVAPCSEIQSVKPEGNVFHVIESNEKEAILNALLQNKGNITYAAKQLNISRQCLNYRMRKYDISRNND